MGIGEIGNIVLGENFDEEYVCFCIRLLILRLKYDNTFSVTNLFIVFF